MIGSRHVLRTILMLALLAAPLGADAQPRGKIPRIGALAFGTPALEPMVESFRQGLRGLGYVEGSTVAVEVRYAEGRADRYSRLVGEMIGLQPNVIVVWGTELAQAVRRATSTIPVVLAVADRPVEMGLVASLARPGGNVTGLTSLNFELSAKRLELLKEVLPKLSRVAVLYGPDPRVPPTLEEMRAAGRRLGIKLQPLEVRGPEDFDHAFDEMVRARAGAVVVLPYPGLATHQPRLADLARKRRLPMIGGGPDRTSPWGS
ncbi:MAG TPA: ABC transporter substrate-binding protein [Methylomirabilota bacterium]|nr:ABC transporter substrate-binding protein [Methylomirabilota bacterium]